MGIASGGSVYELRHRSAPYRRPTPSPVTIVPVASRTMPQRSSSPQHVDHLVDDSWLESVNTK